MRIASILPLALSLLLGTACCQQRQATASGAEAKTPAAGDGFHTGTVTGIYVDDGCPFLIIVDKSPDMPADAPNLLLPIALDGKYLKTGLRLRFRYRLSRAPSGECMKGTPAILEEVSVM